MEKLIISACICGAEVTKEQNPAVPYTVEEIVREAKSAYDAGAALIHLHVREVGEGDFSMGNIWDGITREDIKNDFKMCNVYSREECRNCWARLYCSGGCAANAFYAADSILGVYEYGCKLFKKRIECAIMMKVAEAFDD